MLQNCTHGTSRDLQYAERCFENRRNFPALPPLKPFNWSLTGQKNVRTRGHLTEI